MMIKVAVSDCFKLKMIPSFRSVFFPEKQEIHYIGGTDILPLPLSSEEEGHAISLLGGGQDEEGKKLLIEHNLRLVVYIAKKFDNTGVGVEDLISIGTIGLIKAINTFNPEKNIKLATYASRCIENEILMYLRRNNKTKLEVSIDEPLNVDWDGNELLLSDILGTEEDTIYRDMETEAEHKLLGKAIGRLSNRERVIVQMRFGLGTPDGEEKTQKEIVEEFTDYLAEGIADVVNVLRPEIVAIGGGLSAAADLYLGNLEKKVNERIFGGDYLPVKIEKAAFGNDAGIIGATLLENGL